MSARATCWAWDQVIKPHSAKLVLLCLADSHDANTGRIDANTAHIAEMTNLSTKTVNQALKKLVSENIIIATDHSVSLPIMMELAPPGFAIWPPGGAP